MLMFLHHVAMMEMMCFHVMLFHFRRAMTTFLVSYFLSFVVRYHGTDF